MARRNRYHSLCTENLVSATDLSLAIDLLLSVYYWLGQNKNSSSQQVKLFVFLSTQNDLHVLKLNCKRRHQSLPPSNLERRHPEASPVLHVFPPQPGGQAQRKASPRSWQVPPLLQVVKSHWRSPGQDYKDTPRSPMIFI